MSTTNTSLHQKLIITIIGLFLIGCSRTLPSANQIDKSPFTGLPCAAPCWQGVTIGESNEKEVISTISKLTFIDQDKVNLHRMSMPTLDYSHYASGVEITANCLQPNKQCLTVKVVNNILTEVEILLNYDVKVNEAIQYLGDPDYVGYDNLGAERVICGVYLVWNNKQLVLSSIVEGAKGSDNCHLVHNTGKIPSNLLISKVTYMSTAALKALLSTGTGEFFRFSGTIPE